LLPGVASQEQANARCQGYRGGAVAHAPAPGATGECASWTAKDALPVDRCSKDGAKKLVSTIQKQLKVEADGYFGSETEKAVTEYQATHDESGKTVARGKGLEVDGVVGPATWSALIGKGP
jgi:peptidoglycan hydrolase-like protein with peptidoglycan-binding domain